MTSLKNIVIHLCVIAPLTLLAQVQPPIHDFDAKIHACIHPVQNKNRMPVSFTNKGDNTPPSDPVIKKINLYSIFNISVEFSGSEDPESGISYYGYTIGRTPGGNDIVYGQSTGLGLKTYDESMYSLGLQEGETFYITVYASNNDGLFSNKISTPPLKFTWEDLGKTGSKLTFAFAEKGLTATGEETETFSASERASYMHFMQRIIPIIEELYGPPSHTYTVTLVRNLRYNSSNVFFSGPDEIHIGTGPELNPRLMTHELIHAFRDNVCISSDSVWKYDPKLSGFEEGFAEGLANKCMNRYVELYPKDLIVHPNGDVLYNPIKEGYYDFLNDKQLTTEDFWSESGGTLLVNNRYDMAASAILKLMVEDKDFAKKFNAKYYAELNKNHKLTNSRALISNYFKYVLTSVEGKPTLEWIDQQRIFDCKIVPGKKIFTHVDYYPSWLQNIIYQRITYFETFPNGSEWYYNGQYHQLNGASGKFNLFDHKGVKVKGRNFTILPAGQPFSGTNEYNGFATKYLALTTNDSLYPTPTDPLDDYVFDIDQFQLYNFQVTVEGITENYPRVIGDTLKGFKGIYGSVLNGKGGNIAFKHDQYPTSDTARIVRNVFLKKTDWSSVYYPNFNRNYAKNGQVSVTYRDSLCDLFEDKRNVVFGDRNDGIEIFLFDTKNMKKTAFNAVFTNTNADKKVTFTQQAVNADYWNWTFGDNTTSTEAKPVHQYAAKGNYIVCMTAGREKEGCKTKVCKVVAVGTTGIEEKELQIKSYPNPTDGLQTIVLGEKMDVIKVQVTDVAGKVMSNHTFNNSDRFQLDFSTYSKGVYLVQIEINGRSYVLQTIH